MMKCSHRVVISLLCVLFAAVLLCSCNTDSQTAANKESVTETVDASAPELVVDIEDYRRRAKELCENDPVGPGYVTLTLNDNDTLCAVRIEFPHIRQDGTISGVSDVEFYFDGRKPSVMPYSYMTDYYEQRKHLDAVRILKGIYGVYMLYADGTLECDAGSFPENALRDPERIDREKFGTDMLLETYGIDVKTITNAAVTAEYQK